jgi:hypothetical protein
MIRSRRSDEQVHHAKPLSCARSLFEPCLDSSPRPLDGNVGWNSSEETTEARGLDRAAPFEELESDRARERGFIIIEQTT